MTDHTHEPPACAPPSPLKTGSIQLGTPTKVPIPSSDKASDLEEAAKRDQIFLSIQEPEDAEPRVLVASRATLTSGSSVLAARVAEVGPGAERLEVAAAAAPFDRLYRLMQAVALVEGAASPIGGVPTNGLVFTDHTDLTTTLPLAVRFGAAPVVQCLVEGVQKEPTMEGIAAVDECVPDEGALGGFQWGTPVADLLANSCLACTWAPRDGRTYYKVEDNHGGVLLQQRIEKGKGPDVLCIPRLHQHNLNWGGGEPRRVRTLQVLLRRSWTSGESCGLTRGCL